MKSKKVIHCLKEKNEASTFCNIDARKLIPLDLLDYYGNQEKYTMCHTCESESMKREDLAKHVAMIEK